MADAKDSPIQHVSDTALWVATYRARESERPDALFKDPFARKLVGEKGEHIARVMPHSDRVAWSVVIRTCIIDNYIREAVAHGVDTILNLGAGLDTRPYRMDLPADLQWIEIDYPSIVDMKTATLKDEKPRCHLRRISQDLSDRAKRKEIFAAINAKAKRVLVLTEGVLPYLKNEDVAALAEDLRAQDRFTDWIADYYAPFFMEMVRLKKISSMKNAPFQFDPKDWKAFFQDKGWHLESMRYMVPEGLERKRYPPGPFIWKIMGLFMSKKRRKAFMEISGYGLLRAR